MFVQIVPVIPFELNSRFGVPEEDGKFKPCSITCFFFYSSLTATLRTLIYSTALLNSMHFLSFIEIKE